MKLALAALLVGCPALLCGAPAALPSPTSSPTPAPLFAGAVVKPIVLLDAGHGGEDTGVKAGEFKESVLTLELAKGVGALLAAQGVEVIFTRSGDQALSV